ncbi:carbohydrate deacetylase-like [Ptychodera flava]|uniref:carbohydrate deacetylase-like n=1 Tax=Ptychodera flava TaxID=63121 RepID=UPI003969D501
MWRSLWQGRGFIEMNNHGKVRRLVINGDDFGYCPERNRGIVECFQKKAITSASLMINAVYMNDAVVLAKKHSLPLGLHLNLTEGLPVSQELINKESSSLLTSDGYFHGKYGFRESLKKGLIDVEEVRMEIRAQILRFRDVVGEMPLYVDGHQHCHVLSGIRNVFAEVLQECGIGMTRLPIEFGLEKCVWLDKAAMAFFKGIEEDAKIAKEVLLAHGVRHPHGYMGLSTMGSNMSVEHIQSALLTSIKTAEATSAPGSTLTFELMTHPGYPASKNIGGCGQGPDEFACSKDRVHEMDVLKTPKLKQFFSENNVRLCTFRELVEDI